MSAPAQLVRVYVVQDARSGQFLRGDLGYSQSLKGAGRIYDMQEARDTAVSQIGYEWEIHEFWEFE
jgi:hypothetical protein